MRICALNSDNFGDVLLRQPLYQALLDAGHELAIVLLRPFADFVRSMLPGAVIIPFELNPYDYPALSRGDYAAEIDRVKTQIAEFAPDHHLIARFEWTLFDELIVEQFPETQVIGFNGYSFPGVLHNGEPAVSRIRFARQAEVTEEQPEHSKNQAMARLILGPDISLQPASVRLAPEDLQAASDYLRGMGFEDGAYWVVCAGESAPYPSLRNWPLDRWAQALSEVIRRYGYPILFTGTPNESDAVEVIRAQMGASSAKTHNLCPNGRSLSFLAGITHFSRGYIGRDTGPMHLAAALGKPVIAVFAGGTWPRCIPTTSTGAALSIQTPCAGCKSSCHLATAHCIKDVPLDAVLEAIDDLEHGLLSPFQVRAPQAGPALLASMLRESRISAQAARQSGYQEQARLGYELGRAALAIELLRAQVHDTVRQREAEDANSAH